MNTSFPRASFLRAGGIASALTSLASFAQPAKASKKPTTEMKEPSPDRQTDEKMQLSPLVPVGGGLKLGEHSLLPEGKSERLKTCNLLLSLRQNFGLETDQFGTSTGTLTGLEWTQ